MFLSRPVSPKYGWALLLWALLILLCGVGHAAQSSASGEQALIDKYPAIRAQLEKNRFGAPIHLESAESTELLRADMYGVFPQPFEAVRAALSSPAGWCDIASQQMNVKACTAKKKGGQWLLTMYLGRKYYQAPADAYPLALSFRLLRQEPRYLRVALAANRGPLYTRDILIGLEAVPLDQARTLVHFSYSYGSDTLARLAIKSYFATIGRDKVGFSMIDGGDGTASPVDGVRGSIERNALRYYLAVESYLESDGYPEAERFERRIGRWYDLTARYPLQLKEMEKPEYLAAKRREHLNQLMLQTKRGGSD